MHMSATLVRRSYPVDVLRHVFKQRRVENDRSHSTGMTRSLGLHGFPSSTYTCTHSKIKHTKMKGHAYKIWGAIARSSPCHATPLLWLSLSSIRLWFLIPVLFYKTISLVSHVLVLKTVAYDFSVQADSLLLSEA